MEKLTRNVILADLVVMMIVAMFVMSGCKDKPRQNQIVNDNRPYAGQSNIQASDIPDGVTFNNTVSDAGRKVGYEIINVEGTRFIQIEFNNAPWIKM